MLMGILTAPLQQLLAAAPAMIGKILLWWGVFAALYIIINIIIARIQAKIIGNATDTYAQRNSKFVGRILFIILLIFAILITFEVVGLDASLIMWGISLSLWFAMQSTIENLVSGILIFTNQKIKLWETIQFLWSLKIMGTIEEITLRYTVIRTFDKRRVIIPNNIVAKTAIRPMKWEALLRWEISITVPRHTPIEQIKSVFTTSINSQKYILHPEYTTIFINTFNDKWIELKGFFFVDPSKKSPFMATRKIRTLLLEDMKKYGVSIPYPHISLTTE